MNNKMKIKAVLWCRVSSKEQEESGYSLPSQEKFLADYCHRKQIGDYKIFSVSESASGKATRQRFHDMFAFVKKNNINIIVCEKADRLTRNFKDMVAINEWLEQNKSREIHLVKDSLVLHGDSKSQEKLHWGIGILFATNYIHNLGEEVKKGQIAKLKAGWLPTSPPIGYKTIGEKGHKIHVIDERTSSLVNKMFTLYSTGNYSLKRITNKIHDLGLRNSRGNKIVKSRIHMLLQSKFYIGINVWSDKEYIGKQETFITKELFDRVQRVMKGGGKPPTRSKHKYLFRGLFTCQYCKGTITWETQRGIIYGHCNHHKPCPTKHYATEKEVEKQIKPSLKQLVIKSPHVLEWLRIELKSRVHDETEVNLASFNEHKQQLGRYEKAKDKIYEDKLFEKISEEKYIELDKKYKAKIDEINEKIQNISLDSDKNRKESLHLFDLAQSGYHIYKKTKDKENKQILMRKIYSQRELYEDKFHYQYSEGMESLLKAVRQTNRSKLAKKVKVMEESFEHKKKIDINIKSDAFAPLRTEVLRQLKAVRTFFAQDMSKNLFSKKEVAIINNLLRNNQKSHQEKYLTL